MQLSVQIILPKSELNIADNCGKEVTKIISNTKLDYSEIEYLDKEAIDKLPGFEKCVVMFANEHNGQTCSLDIEGNGNFRKFAIRREVSFTNDGDEIIEDKVRYILIFLDANDHVEDVEDAIKYLKEHWIPGKTKLHRRLTPSSNTIVDVQFNEDSLTSNSK